MIKSKDNKTNLQLPIKDFDFLLTPSSIRSTKDLKGSYTIQLEKGCKQLHHIDEGISLQNNKEYIFQQKKGYVLKAYKQRSMNFMWSLYRKNDHMLEFVDSFRIDLSECYTKYTQELRRFSFQYSKLLQQKNEELLREGWRSMKAHLVDYRFQQFITNTSGDLTIECSIQIKNAFDYVLERPVSKLIRKKTPTSQNGVAINKEKKVLTPINDQKGAKYEETANTEESSRLLEQNSTLSISSISPKSAINHLQINSLLKFHTLSDIVQASNEGESHYNGKQSQVYLPEETVKANPMKKKTYHFEANIERQDLIKVKRNNSLEAFCQSNLEPKDKLPSSTTNQAIVLNQKPISSDSSRLKYLFLIIICFLLLGLVLKTSLPKDLPIRRQLLQKHRSIHKKPLTFQTILAPLTSFL